jgi:O-antigen ligase
MALVLFLLYGAGLIIYNSRNIMIGLIIIAFIAIIRNRKLIPNSIKFGFVFVVIAILCLSQRYTEEIKFMFSQSATHSTRYVINSCSLKIASESNFMGIDHTLIQDKLSACYGNFEGNEELKNADLNSHNQYFDYLLKGGFLLLIAFILTLFIKLKYALKHKNTLYFSITLLFAMSFITENVLIRQFGIYIYAFCDVLLLGSILGPSGSNETHTDNKIIESHGRD